MKLLLSCCAFLLLLAVACEPVPTTEKSAHKTTTISPSAVVDSMFAAFNAHNWTAMANCYSNDAKFLDPSIGQDFITQTHAETIEKYNGLQQAIPDIRDSIVHKYVDSNIVIVEFISKGTVEGKPWQIPICAVLTVENGKIVRDATYYDNQ
ncbi:ketosteroid isomerase-like protein [Chitinophaga skermanii]|uniref:Ketosteroid isomerase-like protein n=1 Tax=Chitinophaga skermanii TaxID=331697 RepID=A0A327QYK7_9BACT|nr:nuclear transport factor 2 family protein [Chitinophaga skermanii]RAJ08503.1 ketosteroid isomerase-like protein [Chitinophaga skermanii]